MLKMTKVLVLHRLISLAMVIFFAALPKTTFAGEQCGSGCAGELGPDFSLCQDDDTCTWCAISCSCTQPDANFFCGQEATCWGAVTATYCDITASPRLCAKPTCGTPCTDDKTCKGADTCKKCSDVGGGMKKCIAAPSSIPSAKPSKKAIPLKKSTKKSMKGKKKTKKLKAKKM